MAGSSVEQCEEDLNFKPEEEEDQTIADILVCPPDGQFSLSGEIKWLEYQRTVNVRGYQKSLREAQIIDKSNKSIHLTVWRDHLMSKINEENTYRLINLAISYWNGNIRITTTPNSTVSSVVKGSFDWSQCPLSSHKTRVLCKLSKCKL